MEQTKTLIGDKGSYLDARIELIKKVGGIKNYKPSKDELEDAYGYLNYCINCGKQIGRFEEFTHCLLGNSHKFGCSKVRRCFGWVFGIIKIPFLIVALIVVMPFYLCHLLFDKLNSIKRIREK